MCCESNRAHSIRHCTDWSNKDGLASEWGESENSRRAKYYSLTKKGRKQLEVETTNWERLAAAVAQILETT